MSSKQPNILLIMDDQHRIDCLGAYGNTDIKTPNLDALANEGVRFDNSFCSFPVCTPSRYSLISGRWVHEHRGWSNHCTPAPGTPAYPAILKEAGYRSAAVGKMHFTPTYLDVGFEQMKLAEQNGAGRWDDDYHRDLKRHGLFDHNDLEDQERPFRDHARKEYWDTYGAMVSNLPEEHHSTTWIGDRAVEVLEDWSESGNHLFASFIKPHHPFDPPQRWVDLYDPDQLTLLPGWTEDHQATEPEKAYFDFRDMSEAQLRRVMAYCYASISQIDHEIGRMVDVLRKKGLYENTLILFTSDHGDYMGFRHQVLKGGHMYDPLAKVPLIIRFPDGSRAGTASSQLVSNVDVAPTLLRQVGLTPPPEMHGLDLVDEKADREFVFCGGRSTMVRSHTRKLILSAKGKPLFFFDLENDPLESSNLVDDPAHADEVKRFEAAASEWLSSGSGYRMETYLDERAPRIAADNVPDLDDGHREEIIAWYEERMREVGGL